jgi:RNA polymerase sigma-70 factor (ECF subfamily)
LIKRKKLTKERFKELFDLYFEEIRRYIFYRSGNASLAEDVTQTAFLKLWEKQPTILPGKERALIYKIAGDEFLDNYRKQQSHLKFQVNYTSGESILSPQDKLEYKELQEQFNRALTQMKQQQRVVFMMNRNEGLTYNEIACRLKLSVKAIEKRMKGALATLKSEFKQYEQAR